MYAPLLARLWYVSLIMIFAWSLAKLFRPAVRVIAKGRRETEPNATYLDLRHRVLMRTGLPPAPAGADPTALRAVAMDWRIERATVTLVALDDAVSLYYSTGGGIIGAGAHEAVRQASALWFLRSKEVSAEMVVSESVPLPPPSSVNFWEIRAGETRMSGPIDVGELDPAAGGPFVLLYDAAQQVITAVRQIPLPKR